MVQSVINRNHFNDLKIIKSQRPAKILIIVAISIYCYLDADENRKHLSSARQSSSPRSAATRLCLAHHTSVLTLVVLVVVRAHLVIIMVIIMVIISLMVCTHPITIIMPNGRLVMALMAGVRMMLKIP